MSSCSVQDAGLLRVAQHLVGGEGVADIFYLDVKELYEGWLRNFYQTAREIVDRYTDRDSTRFYTPDPVHFHTASGQGLLVGARLYSLLSGSEDDSGEVILVESEFADSPILQFTVFDTLQLETTITFVPEED